LLLLLRAAHWHLARRYYVASLLLASFTTPWLMAPVSPWGEVISDVLVWPLAFGLLLWNLNEFLPGLRLWGPGQRTVAWALVLLQSASTAAVFWLPDVGLAMLSTSLALGGFTIAVLVALARVYYRADPRGRRQIKWVIYGFYVSWLPNLYGAVDWARSWISPSPSLAPEWNNPLLLVYILSSAAMPLGLLVAVAFYQLLDIDRLFSATLSYTVLAILGLAMVLGVMPAASRVASDALGLDPTSSQLLVAIVLAAVLVPAQRIIRPWIDRWLFPERVTLEQGFAQLLTEIPSTPDLQDLTQRVGERLDALLRPAAAVLYARAGHLFTPLAARGRGAPPALAARSALIAALQERTTPLAAQRWTARRTTSLTPIERAVIETLDVAVLVPIRREAELAAFYCLGPKRSGDIYTPTDLAWLGAVAGAISDRLLALGQTRLTGQASGVPAVDREEASTQSTVDTVGATAAADDSDEGVFRQEGEYWTLAYRGKTARLRDTKGLSYIARLLEQPGRDLHVRDLAATDHYANAPNGPVYVEGDLGTILDARAAAQYKERLTEARQELEAATAAGDLGQAARVQHEIESLTEQLTAAYGIGGRPRAAGDPAERVRKAVTNRIRHALDRIRAAHPALGRHLTNAVRTGFVCAYHPEHPVAWQL